VRLGANEPAAARESVPEVRGGALQRSPPSAKARNVNLQAAYLHVLGDLAQSVAVLVAGVVIWFRPAWIVVDPLCTLGFCVLVFYSTLGVVRASMSVLLEEVPPQISWTAIYKDLAGISHLRDVHDLHIWCISDGVPSLSLHASCDDGKCEEALKSITAICKRYGIEHITAQVRRNPGDIVLRLSFLAPTPCCHTFSSLSAAVGSTVGGGLYHVRARGQQRLF
jgi:cation diffusion facilitator family transporter